MKSALSSHLHTIDGGNNSPRLRIQIAVIKFCSFFFLSILSSSICGSIFIARTTIVVCYTKSSFALLHSSPIPLPTHQVAIMHFTDDQLENDPELRPRAWKSEKAFEQERLFLLHRLATNLRAAAENPSSNPSTTTMASSSTTSLISTTSEVVAVYPDQTPCSNCSIFPCSLIPSMPFTPRSMSSFFSNSFGSVSRTSIASSDSAFTPHTPVVFNSPQASTSSFETASPSPLKVDSAMGSPLRLLRSPSILSLIHI